MNLEIHKPELEQRVREQIQSGQFNDLDELLEKALDALEQKETAAVTPRRPAGRKSLAQLFADSPFNFTQNLKTRRLPERWSERYWGNHEY
jgi:Arc/MetJ-type ribon-helix-helix transcriptional regulator